MSQPYKQIIITGASSMIGLPLLSLLEAELKSGELLPVSRKQENDYSSWDMTTQSLDASDLKDKLQAKGKKALIHCAPIWFLAEHVSALAASGVKRIIAFSSTSIEGKSASVSRKEQQVVKLLKEAEESVQASCDAAKIQLTIFRPTMIYGQGQGQNIAFIAKVVKSFAVFPVVSKAQGLRKPVHVTDLASAAVSVLNNTKTFGKTYNLSGGETLSYENMVARIFSALDKKVFMPKLPLPLYRLALLSMAKMSALFGKSLPIDPSMADRMRENLDFDSSLAEKDFAYAPSKFLPNGAEDITVSK